MNENEAIKIASGQVSHALLQHLRPVIAQHEKNTLSKMKSMYRSGKVEHFELLACVAELCAIEDIEITLNARVARAVNINKENEK